METNADTVTLPALNSSELDHLLAGLYNACDPNKTAREYYTDLSKARGNASLADDVLRRLKRVQQGSYLRYLFTGHIGGGKSSELLHLVDCLNAPTSPLPGRRYFPIYLDTDEYLNNEDTSMPDLLLAIIVQIGVALKESPINITIVDNYFINLFKRIQETFKNKYGVSSIDLSGKLPGDLAAWKITVSALKRDESFRSVVRDVLTTQLETLRGEINRVLDLARLRLSQSSYRVGELPYTDIVLIIDSLDRVRRFGGETKVEEAIYELFVRNAPTLTGLNVHMTYTLPLRALYAYPGELQSAYGIAPFTMPMVAVEKRREPNVAYRKGLNCLKGMLAERLQEYPPEVIFTQDALEWLLRMSGGHVRSLMIFAQSAFSLTDTLPVDLPTARAATSPTLQLYSRSIPNEYWGLLIELHRSDLRKVDTSKESYRNMLEQLMVLEYRNGDDQPDDLAESWYAVNPLVRLLGGFKAALEVAEAGAAESASGHNG